MKIQNTIVFVLLTFILIPLFSFAQDNEDLPSIGDVLYEIIDKEDINVAVKEYAKLKKKKGDAYDFGEWELNMLGYRLMSEDKMSEAKVIFNLNIEQFPEAPNPYDSFAEYFMKNDMNEEALKYYRIALQKLSHQDINEDLRSWLTGNTKTKIAVLEGKTGSFNWLIGKWEVTSKSKMAGGSWNESMARSTWSASLDGYLLTEEYTSQYLDGKRFITYNVNTGKWETYWLDTFGMIGLKKLEGDCKNDQCYFFGTPNEEGDKTIQKRIRWYDISEDTANFEESYSADDGKTWDVKVIMEYKRNTADGDQE